MNKIFRFPCAKIRIHHFLTIIILLMVCTSCDINLSEKEPVVYVKYYPIEVDSLWGYIDTTGLVVIEPQYDRASEFSYNLAAVMIDDKWGFINEKGQMVIEPVFERTRNFTVDFIAATSLDGKYGFIDTTGTVIIDYNFDYVTGFNHGSSVVRKDGKYGVIDIDGEYIIPLVFDHANNFYGDQAFVAKEIDGEEYWAIYDRYDSLITDFDYRPAIYYTGLSEGISATYPLPGFSEDKAPVMINDKKCYINRKGDVVLETDHELINFFYDGLAYAGEDGLFGFIDSFGTMRIEPLYTYYHSIFINGYARVKNTEDKFGIIDKNQETLIPFEYKYCGNFYHGLIYVTLEDDSWGYINKENVMIWQSEPGSAKKATSALFPVEREQNGEFILEMDGHMYGILREK